YPISASRNPIYALSPGSLIHAMTINHDMCVFAHIHSLGSAHLRSPATRRPKTPRSRATPSFRLEERSKTEPALERALSAERIWPSASTAEAAPTCEPTPLQPLRSKSVSAYSLPST